MYDPTIARFLQEDTYRGDINDPLSLNLYSYCHNNPITYDDPDGHWIHIAIGAFVGAAINTAITAYNDYKDDHKFNAGWKSYAGAAVEGAILGGVAAATGGGSLLAMAAAETAAGFAGSLARQYITTGKASVKKAAKDGLINGAGSIGGYYAGKALGAAGKALSQTKVVTKVKGIALEGLSSTSEAIVNINKKAATSLQSVLEKVNLSGESKLAFSAAGNNASFGINATFDYADKKVMNNFNKIYGSRDEIQNAVKLMENNGSSIGQRAGNVVASAQEYATKVANRTSVIGSYTDSLSASDILRYELKAAGIPNSPYKNAAHHIVPWNDPRALDARNILDDFGINYNSASNGVFLPMEVNKHTGDAALHIGKHSAEYIQTVTTRLQEVVMLVVAKWMQFLY